MIQSAKKPIEQSYSRKVLICASSDFVWKYLTNETLMLEWMSEEPINIITDWKVGGPFVVEATGHWVYSESKGTIIEFKKNEIFTYSHLSSLSKLPNDSKNYSDIEFKLDTSENGTDLTLTLTNFPTEAIYHHLVFYWKITLEVLKKHIEKQYKTAS